MLGTIEARPDEGPRARQAWDQRDDREADNDLNGKEGSQMGAKGDQHGDSGERHGLPEEVDEGQAGVAQFDGQREQKGIGERHDEHAPTRERRPGDHARGVRRDRREGHHREYRERRDDQALSEDVRHERSAR